MFTYFKNLYKIDKNKPRIYISENGVTSVKIDDILKTDVAQRQLKALEQLLKTGLIHGYRY